VAGVSREVDHVLPYRGPAARRGVGEVRWFRSTYAADALDRRTWRGARRPPSQR